MKIPLLILIHLRNDTQSVKDFKTVVQAQLLSERSKYVRRYFK